jgi:hypothetical protein
MLALSLQSICLEVTSDLAESHDANLQRIERVVGTDAEVGQSLKLPTHI